MTKEEKNSRIIKGNFPQSLCKAAMLIGIFAGLITFGSCGSESDDQLEVENPEDTTSVLPSFPGGTEALKQFISDNLKYPPQAEKEGIEGRVVCSFIVLGDGTVSDIEVAQSAHPLLDNEAVRVLKLMPKWNPGKQHGVPISVRYTLPITFRLERNSESTNAKGICYGKRKENMQDSQGDSPSDSRGE